MQIKSLHFIIAIISLFTLAFIIGHVKLKNMPEGTNNERLEKLSLDEFYKKKMLPEVIGIFVSNEKSELCKKFEYQLFILKEKSDLYNIKLYKMDIQNFPEHYNISGTPTLIFFKQGDEMSRVMGIVSDTNLSMIFDRIQNDN